MRIQADNVSKKIGAKNIFSNISFEATNGEIIAITGPSGCGKTTLLNCLGLIRHVDSGKILIDGEDTSHWSENKKIAFWKKYAAFIYQDYGIIDDETVAYNVSLSRSKSNQNHIQEVLNGVGLKGRENDYAVVLSGGEKQRLGIARSIYKRASVIYADEPTASLDTENREKVVRLLKNCAHNGALVILATHDERLVQECNRIFDFSHSSTSLYPHEK